MRELVIKLGRMNMVIIITMVSVLLSILLTTGVSHFLRTKGMNIHMGAGLSIAISVPVIVAPSVSWYLIGMMLRINQLEEEMRRLGY